MKIVEMLQDDKRYDNTVPETPRQFGYPNSPLQVAVAPVHFIDRNQPCLSQLLGIRRNSRSLLDKRDRWDRSKRKLVGSTTLSRDELTRSI